MDLSLSKIILLLIFILIIPLKNTFSEECDELTKARMIKAGISDEIIKNQCDGKSKVVEESKPEVVEESKPEVEVDSNNLHTKYLRFYLGSAQGTFNFSSNDALDGDFDHDLSGVAFGASYIKIDEDNFLKGIGFQRVNVGGKRTPSKDKIPGFWTYSSSSLGYFDVEVTVNGYYTSFLYGLYGYDMSIIEQMNF